MTLRGRVGQLCLNAVMESAVLPAAYLGLLSALGDDTAVNSFNMSSEMLDLRDAASVP